MEVIKQMKIENARINSNISIIEYVGGVLFCKGCGKQYKQNEVDGKCIICDCNNFINGSFASKLAAYMQLSKHGTLKHYYNTITKKSAVRMNNKRIIIWLLMHRDKYIKSGDKEIVEAVRKALWKKF